MSNSTTTRRKLNTRGKAPPVNAEGFSYRYTHPETGHKSQAMDYGAWQEKIYKHRRGNGLDIPPDMMEIAEDQLCATLPPHLCTYRAGAQSIDVRIGISQVRDWLDAVKRKVFSRGEFYVEQSEAERRAAICVGCFYNVNAVGGCGGGCKKLAEFLTPGMSKRKTTYDDRLKNCAVCGCYNRISAHFPLAVLEEHDTPNRQEAYPNFCWRHRGGINYREKITTE